MLVLVIQSSRHCSEQMLVRQERIKKRSKVKERVIFYLFFKMSQVMTEEMSFQVSLENCQGFSIPDRGGKFIPPARNGK